MGYLENLEYKKRILYDTFTISTGQANLYFSKHKNPTDGEGDRFYFRLYEVKEETAVGDLYFYMNLKEKETKFIGLFINENFRNQGYAEFLLSIWISFCLNSGIQFIKTIDRQRKPFLLYLLKKFTFDCMDRTLYQTERKRVDICKKEEDITKYLHFSDSNQESGFRNSNILKEDNYVLLSDNEFEKEEIEKLDSVFLLKPYLLQEKEKAYQKAKKIKERYQ